MTKPHKKVTAAIITRDNKILIAQRAKKDELYGKWEFPGGKMEPGETEQECLKRELLEEFGIEVEIGEYVCSSFFVYNGTPMEMLAYYVTLISNDFVLYEHQQIKWVEKRDLLLFDFPEPDKPIIQKLLENKNFILKFT